MRENKFLKCFAATLTALASACSTAAPEKKAPEPVKRATVGVYEVYRESDLKLQGLVGNYNMLRIEDTEKGVICYYLADSMSCVKVQ